MSKHSKVWLWLLTVVLSASNLSCAVSKNIATVDVSPPPGIQSIPTELSTQTLAPTVPGTSANPPLAKPTDNITTSQTPSVVTVTAENGNLFIRRGPDLAYNPISVLLKGETVTALARDVLAKWVQIPIPGQPGKTGWVSIQTGYSVINGNVADLPEIQTADWPVASYLRNCTYHQMIVKPGNTILPSLSNSPENEVWIYPGVYTVYDLDVPGEPEVLAVEMREGISIDIREDGNGEKRKCP